MGILMLNGNNYTGGIQQVYGKSSGDIATFDDGGDNKPLKSLKVAINPVQASGTPSPSNPLPISGWTGAEIPRTGKNLVDISDFNVTRQHYGSYFYLNQGTYTFSVDVKNNTAINGNIFLRKRNNSNIAIINVASNMDSRENYTYTISERTEMRIVVTGSTSGYNYDFKNIQIEAGSTATDYEPYNGTTYPITFRQTVYGGKLDVTSGVLKVTDGYIASYNGETLPSTWISDRDVYAPNTSPTTGAEVVYKLATPQEIQLTPTEVTTLLGTNNIWSDTGEIEECMYQRDLNLAFNELWDLVHSNSGTRNLSLSKSAVKEEETEEITEEPKEEEQNEDKR